MKKIATVVGLGVSGLGAARLLNKKGWGVRVTEGADTPEIREKERILSKLGGIKVEIGRHTRSFIEGAEFVVAGPGVKDDSQPLVWARRLEIPVIDEIELGYRYCRAKIVAVTGTNGKSTTATLIGRILKAGGLRAEVCGNIGVSFCDRVAAVNKEDVVVLEVSSFQLQRIVEFRPYVSIFLNITQNHLDRHRDFREYLDAKLNIFKNQKRADWAVLNCEDKNLRHLYRHIQPRILYFGSSAGAEGACLREGAIWLVENKEATRFLEADGIALKGEHNMKNVMASVLAARVFKIRPEPIKEALGSFKGLEHRCEYAAEIDGITFINDSKSTTVDAAMCAIRSLDRPVILIAGGRDKGSDFTVLKPIVEKRVKAIILFGEASQKIRMQLLGSTQIHPVPDLKAAAALSFKLADRGEAVLFSPMCASFDMFRNFEERGECFKKAVRTLITANNSRKLAVCANLR